MCIASNCFKCMGRGAIRSNSKQFDTPPADWVQSRNSYRGREPEVDWVDPESGTTLRLLQGFSVKLLDQFVKFGSTLSGGFYLVRVGWTPRCRPCRRRRRSSQRGTTTSSPTTRGRTAPAGTPAAAGRSASVRRREPTASGCRCAAAISTLMHQHMA
jgi:hypothetical protein